MNKTVNINLGGMVFHIDEDAYQKLSRYFDAIKRSLSNANGQDEIIKDIELRIAELISEKHNSDKQVISIKEIDEIITVMGQPEDYRIEDEANTTSANTYNDNSTNKKLYRDKENGMVGGVLAGLGHYFGVDKVWLRIFLLVMVFAWGTGVLAYIILWIVMPEAVTTAEKLEMKGEPVTISNIEKKVREEFDTVSEKIKNVDYDKMGNQVKTGAEKFATSIGDVLMNVFKVFAKFLGIILIMTSLAMLVILFIGVFTLGSTAFIDFPWQDFVNAGNFSDYPIWAFGVLMFIAVGIPFFFLLLLGFKLLSPSIKSIGNIAKYTLLALWLIAIGILISIGIKQATEFAVSGRIIKKETIALKENDTLYIKFKHNDYYAKNINEHNDFMITQDSSNANVIYSNQVRISILKTDEKLPYLQIEKEAKGKSLSEARKTAETIKYGYKIVGNHLILDNYLLTDFKNKYRDQEVELFLYVPEGTLLKPDSSVQDYDNSDDSFFNLHHSSDNYVYKVGSSQIKCLNCPQEENEWNDIDENDADSKDDTIKEVILKINGRDIISKKTNTSTIKLDENGILIKTK
jgi:phage shock protein PspC (stress-responsive transcriptional regulator)